MLTSISCLLLQHATVRLVCRHSVNSRHPLRKADERHAKPLMVTSLLTRPGVQSSLIVSGFLFSYWCSFIDVREREREREEKQRGEGSRDGWTEGGEI